MQKGTAAADAEQGAMNMRFGYDGAFWWFGWWAVFIHDNGWIVINRRRVEIASGRVPNTGYRRAWWRAR